MAKQPVPGKVKTRLCPPCTPEQASGLALAALEDTLDTVSATPAGRRILLLDGQFDAPDGWDVVAQRGDGLGDRLANGFADAARDPGGGKPALLIGMDTPQVTAALLRDLCNRLSDVDAVLGPAVDGGWWALALREPAHGGLLADVPMSRPDTGVRTLEALRCAGLSVAMAPALRDVDTADDLAEVAAQCQPGNRFAQAVRRLELR